MLVTVVVVHFRQPRELERTLTALRAQTHADLELIVVDDGSPEPPRVPDDVALIVQEDRGNRAGPARNKGAAAARGEVLCFLDADTAPEPEYVERMVAATGPDTVAVGRRRYADYAAGGRELPGPAWLEAGWRTMTGAADDRTYRFVISAVLACPRKLFERVGPFEEAFAEYGGEDWEWAYRAWLAGAELRHVPDAVAWHDGPDWSARPAADRQAVHTAQTLRLADTVTVAGSRPHGIHASRPDVVVHLPEGLTEGAAFVCADSVLAALPEAAVVAPEQLRRRFPADGRLLATAPHRPRVRVDLHTALRVRGDGLARLVRGLAPGAAVTVPGVLTAAHARAAGDPEPVALDDVEPVPDQPDVEAYLGGWG